MSSFSVKRIRVSITLANGAFSSEGNTVVLVGNRIECEIEKSGLPSKATASIKIYGMPEDACNLLTTLKYQDPMSVRRNIVKVETSEGDSTAWSLAFYGEVFSAYAIWNAPPDLFFKLEAISGYYMSIFTTPPKSVEGKVSVSAVMKSLASEMGYDFEDAGVQASLTNQYLYGPPMHQASKLAEAAGIDWGIDDTTLWIAPPKTTRNMVSVPLISPQTGMHNYPVLSRKGLVLTTMYNPAIKPWGLVRVESSVHGVTNKWHVIGVRHSIACEAPNGAWETQVTTAPQWGYYGQPIQ